MDSNNDPNESKASPQMEIDVNEQPSDQHIQTMRSSNDGSSNDEGTWPTSLFADESFQHNFHDQLLQPSSPNNQMEFKDEEEEIEENTGLTPLPFEPRRRPRFTKRLEHDNQSVTSSERTARKMPPLSHLTQFLNDLGPTEREKAEWDIHGVAPPLFDEIIQADELEKKIHEMGTRMASQAFLDQHPGLACAFSMKPSYIENKQLVFLRAHAYNVEAAANGMGRYFDLKQQHFCLASNQNNSERNNHDNNRSSSSNSCNGCKCLIRPLRITDLTNEDLHYFETGFLQLLPIRDAAGRAINVVFFDLINQLQIPVASLIRICMYAGSFLAQSEETQQSGTVLLAFGLQQQEPGWVGDESLATQVIDVCTNLPVRRMATHYLHDPRQPHLGATLIPLFTSYMQPFDKARVRSHHGTFLECCSVLGSLGIPIESLPIQEDQHGEAQVKVKSHLVFLEEQKRIDQAEEEKEEMESQRRRQQQQQQQETNQSANNHSIANESITVTPQDVVMGRDFLNRYHPGNISYREMLTERFSEYENANRSQKMAIVNDILMNMNDKGARFVSRQRSSSCIGTGPEEWVVANLKTVRQKIAHDLRNLRLKGEIS